MWELRYRRDEFSIEAGRAKGRPLPDWFHQKPALLPGDALYMGAFWDLDSERSIGGGLVGKIPWSRARDYARDLGFEVAMLGPFWQIVATMDAAYRHWLKTEHDRAAKSLAPSKTRGNRTRSWKGRG